MINYLHTKQIQFHTINEPSTIDGGDVLVMKKIVFIGVTNRTNMRAIFNIKNILAKNKSQYTVCPIIVQSLHLKSVVSGIDNFTIVVSDCDIGKSVMNQIITYCSNEFEFVLVPDREASNVLCINENLIIQKNFPNSERVFERVVSRKGLKLHKLDMSEFIKADGALTCCSIKY